MQKHKHIHANLYIFSINIKIFSRIVFDKTVELKIYIDNIAKKIYISKTIPYAKFMRIIVFYFFSKDSMNDNQTQLLSIHEQTYYGLDGAALLQTSP